VSKSNETTRRFRSRFKILKKSNPKCPLVFAFVIPDFFRQIGLGLLWLDSVYLSFARQLEKVVITRWTKQHRPQLHQIIEPPFDYEIFWFQFFAIPHSFLPPKLAQANVLGLNGCQTCLGQRSEQIVYIWHASRGNLAKDDLVSIQNDLKGPRHNVSVEDGGSDQKDSDHDGNNVFGDHFFVPTGGLPHSDQPKDVVPHQRNPHGRDLDHAQDVEQELDDRRNGVVSSRNLPPELGKVVFQPFPDLEKVSLRASANAELDVDRMVLIVVGRQVTWLRFRDGLYLGQGKLQQSQAENGHQRKDGGTGEGKLPGHTTGMNSCARC